MNSKECTFLGVEPNNHLQETTLKQILEDWDILEKYQNLDSKKEIITALQNEFPEHLKPTYIKVYLFKYEGKIFALTGCKPTEKALGEIKGLTKYLNILRKDPQKISEYCNDLADDLVSSDPVISKKIQMILDGKLNPEDITPKLRDTQLWFKGESNTSETGEISSDSTGKIGISSDSTGQIGISSDSKGKSEISSDLTGKSEMSSDSNGKTEIFSEPSENHEISLHRNVENIGISDKNCNSYGFSVNAGKLLKIPIFDENNVTASEYVQDVKYSLDLARVTDERTAVAQMLWSLPKALNSRARQALNRLQPDPEKVKISDFETVLIDLTKKSSKEIDRELRNMKFSGKKFRDFYLLIETKVKQLNPKVTDQKAIDDITTREFIAKCPDHVKNNVGFRTSTLKGLEIADLAESVAEITKNSTSANYFSKSSDKSDNDKGKGSERGSFRGRSKGFRGRGKGRSDFGRKDSQKIVCFFCFKPGHKIADCEEFKKHQKSKQENKGGRGPKKSDKQIE